MSVYLKILREGGLSLLFKIFFDSAKEVKRYSITRQFYQILQINIFLFLGHHRSVLCISHKMIRNDHAYGFFYSSRSLFLLGKYQQSRSNIQKFINKYPNHADAVYLLVEILKKLGAKDEAWLRLTSLALNVKRLKTWSMLANMISSHDEYVSLQGIYQKAFSAGTVGEVSYSPSLTRYFSNASLRVGADEEVKNLWRELYKNIINTQSVKVPVSSKPYFSVKTAKRALTDLDRVFEMVGSEYFLISGTLLGCIREGKLLTHDKDIDIGIWSSGSVDNLLTSIAGSGLFYILESRSPHLILLKHISGISVDVFIHHIEKSCWHSGVKVKWHNSAFDLVEKNFLGRNFLIPKDYERYLEENYGEWRQPKIDFDSALDTTNAEVISDIEMIAYLYGKLLGDIKLDVRYKEELLKMGEPLGDFSSY